MAGSFAELRSPKINLKSQLYVSGPGGCLSVISAFSVRSVIVRKVGIMRILAMSVAVEAAIFWLSKQPAVRDRGCENFGRSQRTQRATEVSQRSF